MPISFIAFAFLSLFVLPVNGEVFLRTVSDENGPVQPLLPPDTSLPETEAIDMDKLANDIELTLHPEKKHPTQILIPALGINSHVVNVGVNAAGEMEVPDGSTNNVGWYKYGTVPGEVGSAVMDAHVYAAFKKLKRVENGNRIYVVNARGETLEFKVVSSKVYPLSEVPMDTIFTDASGTYLNLITCEGRYSVTKGTYSHRRVVYAELVE